MKPIEGQNEVGDRSFQRESTRTLSSSASDFDNDDTLESEKKSFKQMTPNRPNASDAFVTSEEQKPGLSPEDSIFLESLEKRGLSPEQAYAVIGHADNSSFSERSIDYVVEDKLDFNDLSASSGSSLVYLGDKTVHQFYDKKMVYDRVISFPENLPGFVKKISQDDTAKVVCWEKVTPFSKAKSDPNVDVKQVLVEAKNALFSLHELGGAHGDSTADNLGVDKDGHAAWFDFDRFKPNASYEQKEKDLEDYERTLGSNEQKKSNLSVPPPSLGDLNLDPNLVCKSRRPCILSGQSIY
ncbi:MAG: hypothetical protein WCK49_06245 [Myxococcaceae bacterium]